MFPVGRSTAALAVLSLFVFHATGVLPSKVYAYDLVLPGAVMAAGIDPMQPAVLLKGVTLDPKDPFQINFIIDPGTMSLMQIWRYN